MKIMQELIGTILPQNYGNMKEDSILDLIGKVKCNTFGIWNHKLDNSKALAMYPSCSYFNHSCIPNCLRYQDGFKLTMRALNDIQSGSQVNISYIELEGDAETRIGILESCYFFQCRCPRCTSNDSEETFQMISQYFCHVKGCSGLIGLVENKKICNGCRREY